MTRYRSGLVKLQNLNGDDDVVVPNGWIAGLKHFSESPYSSLSGGRSAKVWFGSMDNGCERGKADLITEFQLRRQIKCAT